MVTRTDDPALRGVHGTVGSVWAAGYFAAAVACLCGKALRQGVQKAGVGSGSRCAYILCGGLRPSEPDVLLDAC